MILKAVQRHKQPAAIFVETDARVYFVFENPEDNFLNLLINRDLVIGFGRMLPLFQT